MEEIDLYDLLKFYAKKWLTIITFAMIGAIIGVGYTYFVQTPQYTSKAQILLVGETRTGASDSIVLNNYVELFKSHRVLDPVIEAEGYQAGYNALSGNTTAENVKNTDIINVAISTAEEQQSRALLESAIESFRTEAKALYGDNNIKINVVDGASKPAAPANVKPLMQIGLATVAGIILAIIVLFFMYDYRASRRGKATTATSTSAPVSSTPPETPKVIKKNRKSTKSTKLSKKAKQD